MMGMTISCFFDHTINYITHIRSSDRIMKFEFHTKHI
jgi:hypothetical protein